MNYISVIPETITDGEGVRLSIYVAGCHHHCYKCHNPQTWDFNAGSLLTEDIIDVLINQVKNNPIMSGITFSGGDPLAYENAKDLLCFLKKIKDNNINVWCYTGYKIEELVEKNSPQKDCLFYIDKLVDGEFENDKRTLDIPFVGSSNQRIIDVTKWLQQNNINQ